MSTFDISLSYVVYASPSRVYDAMTRQEVLKQWIEGDVLFEYEEGGKVELFDKWVSGEVIMLEKDKALTITWKPNTWPKKSKPSFVTLLLEEHPAGTEVTVEHSGFTNAEEATNHEKGWIDFYFEPLNDYFTQ